jgi:hypothetical protein
MHYWIIYAYIYLRITDAYLSTSISIETFLSIKIDLLKGKCILCSFNSTIKYLLGFIWQVRSFFVMYINDNLFNTNKYFQQQQK